MYEIYMIFKGRRILVETNIKGWWTAVRSCVLYFNRNPKEYIIRDMERDEEIKFHELF